MLEIKPILNALRRSKAGALMLLIQIAITTAIVSNAAYIIYDRIQYLQQDTGYPEDEIFSFVATTFGSDVDLSQQFELDETMLRNIPGVVNASMISEVPLSGSGSASSFHLAPEAQGLRGVRAAYSGSDEHIIDTLGVNLVEGRSFTIDDVVISQDMSEIPKVVIASKAFSDEMFPDGNGLGSTVYLGNRPFQIIGIVDKMMGPWLKDRRADNFLFMPFANARNYQKFVVRTEPSERAAVMRQIEERMLEAYDKRVIIGLEGLDESKANYNSSDTLMLRMLVVLIVVLVLITGLGIFGLTLFNINKRTKQIGTRRALGARKSAIVQYFLLENFVICAAGLALGSATAVYLGKVLLEQYSLPALDNTYIVMTAVFVMVVSLASVLMPAYRASNISPSIATRSV